MAKHKFEKGQWLRITWEDACGYTDGWIEGEEVAEKAELAVVISVGLVVLVDKKKVSLAQSRDDQGHVDHIISVPKGWIKKVEVLGV